MGWIKLLLEKQLWTLYTPKGKCKEPSIQIAFQQQKNEIDIIVSEVTLRK